jgi:hypothetical protein
MRVYVDGTRIEAIPLLRTHDLGVIHKTHS